MKYSHTAIELRDYLKIQKILARLEADSSPKLRRLKLNNLQLFHCAPEARLIIQKGRIVLANPAAAGLLGAGHPAQLCGRLFLDLVPPEYQAAVAERLGRTKTSPSSIFPRPEQYCRLDGSIVAVESWGTALRARDGFLWVARDVGAEKRAMAELQASEAKFRELFHNLGDAVALLDCAKPFRIREVNNTAVNELGYAREELIDQPVERILAPDWRAQRGKIAQKLLRETRIIFETVAQCKNGRAIPVEATGFRFTLNDRPVLLVIGRDISERQKMEARIKKLTFYDQVTGVYNRAYLEEELKRLDKKNGNYGVIMGDINGLKLVNDTFGHDTGDNFLRKAAKLLQEACHKEDLIARWGGDEFAILLTDATPQAAERLCQRIKKRFLSCESQPITLSIALGFAVKDAFNQTHREIIKAADERMYRNKLQELNNSYDSLLTSLQMDPIGQQHETDEHSRRLKAMAQKMGDLLGLSLLEKDNLALLATLHDIGKVAVPDIILAKPGPLTPLEFTIIQKHPEVGYRIAKLYLNHIAEGILTHHERWDGTGYPLGLKGEQIPLIARIVAIVDAYDAMTHDRVYRKALRQEEALAELERHAGSQFDPQLVRVFLEFFRSNPGAVEEAL